MLTGKELGAAIRAALIENGKTPADAARHFGVKPPSVSGWMTTGRIGKGRFDQLVAWLDKTPRSYWGLIDAKPTLLLTHEPSPQHPTIASITAVPPSLEASLRCLGDHLAQLDDVGRASARAALSILVDHPDDFRGCADAIMLRVNAVNDAKDAGRRQESTSSRK